MRSIHPTLTALWRREPGAQRAYLLHGALCLTEGAVLALGGRARVTGDHWAPIYALGGPEGFGTVFALIGIGILAAPFVSLAWVRTALFVGATAHLLLAFLFTLAVPFSATASLVGIVIYVWAGLHFLSHREIYRVPRRRRRGRQQ